MQYVIDLRDLQINQQISMYLEGDIMFLGKEKFSSNVIEKLLDYNTD